MSWQAHTLEVLLRLSVKRRLRRIADFDQATVNGVRASLEQAAG